MGVDPVTGEYVVSDVNGKPTASPDNSIDRMVFSNTLPKLFGGFQNTFSFKGFQLDMLFQFVKQKAYNSLFNNNSSMIPGEFSSFFGTNQPVTVLSRWRKPGDLTNIQQYSTRLEMEQKYYNAASSDAAISDASFVRLKNLSFSYTVPSKISKKMHMQNCRVFVHAQNLLTFTKFQGLDPENQSTTSSPLPSLRMITLGINLTL